VRPGFQGGVLPAAARIRGAAHAAATRRAVERALRGRGAVQARGPGPHGCAQDQQRHGAGAPRTAHGEAPHHRGDGGGPARGRDGYGLRLGGAAVHGVHGRGGHGAPAAQRGAHAPARRRSPGSENRISDPQGRHQRGDALLDCPPGGDALRHRFGGGAPPVPHDGGGVPRHHRGGDEIGLRRARHPAQPPGGLPRRRVQCARPVPALPRR